jgi:hypothetical protein
LKSIMLLPVVGLLISCFISYPPGPSKSSEAKQSDHEARA